MIKHVYTLIVTIVCIVASFSVNAVTINLFDWAYNVNGVMYEASNGDAMPVSGSLGTDGLGAVSTQISGAGTYNFIAYFDFELDSASNTYFNEYGNTGGALAAGQSWEIDEPGWSFGDIYSNVLGGTLDNNNGVSSNALEDVAFALGWEFTLEVGEVAIIDIVLSETLNTGDFFLSHSDPETGPGFNELSTLYFWSSLNIFDDTPMISVSEPPTGALFLTAFLILLLARKKLII